MNIILLGTIVRAMGLEAIDWNQLIADNVKPAFIELNQRALKIGMGLIG